MSDWLVVAAGALTYFAWRNSRHKLQRVVANIAGAFAILFILFALFDALIYGSLMH
jgi:hypothetical protein